MTDQAAWQDVPPLADAQAKALQANRERPLEERLEAGIGRLLERAVRFTGDDGVRAAQGVEHLTRALANLRA